jgi:hypothetical protein
METRNDERASFSMPPGVRTPMRNRGLRVVLLFSVLVLQAVGVYRMVQTDRGVEQVDRRGRAFDLRVRQALLTIAELSAAQQAYVAAGQGVDFWTARVSSLMQALEQDLTALRRDAQSSDSARALGIAGDLARSLAQIDVRAREYLRGQQTVMASDLVFGEGLESATSCAARIDEARVREEEASDAEQARLRQFQMYLLAGTLAVGLLGLLVLLPAGRPADDLDVAPERAAAPAHSMSLAFDSTVRHEPPPPAAAEAALPSWLPDLLAMARLCSDFGRVSQARELPGLLARAAAVLNAAGIIVWVADPADGTLRPALSHGYPAEALARMSKLPRDADNATAEAYRSGQLQTVRGSRTTPGALVAPLLAPAGCVGVMAAEIRAGKEADQHVQALATILAAQLASLLPATPAPSTSPAKA